MITQTYVHSHRCSYESETVVVRPEVENGAFFPKVPVCLELGVELELLAEEDR